MAFVTHWMRSNSVKDGLVKELHEMLTVDRRVKH
jgi:hypothetical protein